MPAAGTGVGQEAASKGFDKAITVPVAPFKFEHSGSRIDSPPRAMGPDTEAVLGEIGIPASEIAARRRQGVI